MTSRTLLRGLGKLVAAVVVAGLGGLAIGVGLAKLSGDDNSSTSVAGGGGPPPASRPHTTTAPGAKRKPPTPQPAKPARDVLVQVLSAILHPATSASGKSRQRARLSVHVRVTNRGTASLVVTRPILVFGGVRVRTDSKQDAPATKLGTLAPGATRTVTLPFEIAGAVTNGVRQEQRAHLVIAGRKLMPAVKLGGPVSNGAARGGSTPSGTTTQSAPPAPPPPVRTP